VGGGRKTFPAWVLLVTGLLVSVIGGVLRWLAVRQINDNPVLMMGAALRRMFESTHHLTIEERMIIFIADHGSQISLAGVGLMVLALALKRQ
jgi:hypothetical protein